MPGTQARTAHCGALPRLVGVRLGYDGVELFVQPRHVAVVESEPPVAHLYSYGLNSYGLYEPEPQSRTYIVMAYIVIVYEVMAYVVLAHVGMAYVAMARPPSCAPLNIRNESNLLTYATDVTC